MSKNDRFQKNSILIIYFGGKIKNFIELINFVCVRYVNEYECDKTFL